MAASLSLCIANLVCSPSEEAPRYLRLRPAVLPKITLPVLKGSHRNQSQRSGKSFHRLRVFAVTEGSAKSSKSSEEKIPSWAQPDSEEPPPWARDELKVGSDQAFEVPFYVYLLASTVTAIAAIGSVFEYANQRPVFGVVNSDSVFYAPLLGFFAIAGLPTSAFLWFKSVQAANKAAEEQDRKDGFL